MAKFWCWLFGHRAKYVRINSSESHGFLICFRCGLQRYLRYYRDEFEAQDHAAETQFEGKP